MDRFSPDQVKRKSLKNILSISGKIFSGNFYDKNFFSSKPK